MSPRIVSVAPLLSALRRAGRALALSLPIACAAACGAPARIHTPAGFALLEEQKEYLYRSTSADGVVIGIRREANKPKANLDFWADAIDRQLRNNRYSADGKPSDVRSANGLPGRQLRYARDDQGRPYRFWATVFVTDDDVIVVETGGDKERFKGKVQESVERALASVTID